jgi:hypothetical protein
MSPGDRSSKYAAGPSPCTLATRNSPFGVVAHAGTRVPSSTSPTAIDADSAVARRSRHPAIRTHSIVAATTATIRNPSPVEPTQDTVSAKGLCDWLSAARPHGKPPYGREPVAASRTHQRPATSAGRSRSRTHRASDERGTQRYASAMSTAPPATIADSRMDSASHGIGPR